MSNCILLKKAFFTLLVMVMLLLVNCTRRNGDLVPPLPSHDVTTLDASRTALSKILARGMMDKDVRELIKKEAAREFDLDYDVLLYKIKDEEIRTGVTFSQYMNSLQGNDKENFTDLLERLPLATLYVPNFVDFSAKNWDTDTQIPFVAALNQRNVNNTIRAFNSEGHYADLDLGKEPPLDVLVLKENERVEVSASSAQARVNGNFITRGGNKYFYFSNDAFNPRKVRDVNAARLVFYPRSGGIDPLVMEAFDKVKACNTCTHRDYIYYSIYPPDGRNEGVMNQKYVEGITQIQLENEAAFNNMGGWAEGNFELHIVASFYQGDSPVKGSDKAISVTAEDLVTYDIVEENEWCIPLIVWTKTNLYCKKRRVKKFTGVKAYGSTSGLFKYANWDMKKYGDTWKFEAFEFDPDGKYKETTTHKTTLGANFKTSDTDGVFKKVGVGFGASATSEKTVTSEYEYSTTSNDLGDAILAWSSPVVRQEASPFGINFATTNILTTGSLLISFETVRDVQ